jgi:hypothetical protein
MQSYLSRTLTGTAENSANPLTEIACYAELFCLTGTREAKPPPPSPPQIELLAREVDGVDLLRAVAAIAPYDFVAVREGGHGRFDIPAHTAPLEELWADIIARSGMQHVARNGFEIVVNACRLLLQTEPSDSVPGDEPITMHFNRISTIQFFALVACDQGLKLYAPEGLPAADLALLIRARPLNQILATVDAVLALETRIEGTQLVVRKRSDPRPCMMTAAEETWRTSLPRPDVLEQSHLSWCAKREDGVDSLRMRRTRSAHDGCLFGPAFRFGRNDDSNPRPRHYEVGGHREILTGSDTCASRPFWLDRIWLLISASRRLYAHKKSHTRPRRTCGCRRRRARAPRVTLKRAVRVG